jgi:hypothetical protein
MLIELGQPARILGDEHRLERALPIARNGKRDRAVLRQHRLRRCPVAMIRLLGRLGLPAAVAQVVRELAGQGALHEHLLHLAEQVIQLRHRLPAAEQRIDGIGVERDRRAEWRGSGVTGFRRARLSWSGHPDLLSQSMPSHTEFRIGPAAYRTELTADLTDPTAEHTGAGRGGSEPPAERTESTTWPH